MYIPSSVPSTLAEMMAFLSPTVDDGLFDSVTYDDDSSPTRIHCIKDGNILFRFTVNSGSWLIEPFIDSAMTPWTARNFSSSHIDYIMRCKGGICIISAAASNIRQEYVIAKTSNGKTGSFRIQISSTAPSQASYSANLNVYPTVFGDNTNLKVFSSGHKVYTNYADNSDRTILTKLPIAGTYGSSDYFSAAFIRNVVQYVDTGEQIIGGKHYGCMWHVAILDE